MKTNYMPKTTFRSLSKNPEAELRTRFFFIKMPDALDTLRNTKMGEAKRNVLEQFYVRSGTVLTVPARFYTANLLKCLHKQERNSDHDGKRNRRNISPDQATTPRSKTVPRKIKRIYQKLFVN